MSRSDRNPSGKPPCTIPGCDRRMEARGLCKTHYMRWSKHGDGFDRSPINPAYANPELSFEARTRRVGNCLVWTGFTNERGYGQIHVEGRRKRAHRYAWERVHGPIPSGMVLDHTCFTPSCVEVDHLHARTRERRRAAIPLLPELRPRIQARKPLNGEPAMPYDGFGARINDHYPIPHHYPGTQESPEEITVICSCGEWEFESIASAGGACDTAWGPDFEAHINDMDCL